ncbi:MAG: DUF1573 domain-containing protein [Bacteroidota bacterium]
MRNLFFLLVMIFGIASCDVRKNDKVVDDGVQQLENAKKDTTTVQLIDSVYNFGTVADGEVVTFNFRFKNSGDKPMVITNTTASCGCTVPEKPEKPIMPGETGFIKVAFNSKGKIGHNEKNITVMANTNPAFPTLVLTGDVKEVK